MSIQTPASEVTTASARASEKRDAYLAALLTVVQADAPDVAALTDLRHTATALVGEQTFPSTRDEEWRFTDLSAMLAIPFQASQTAADVAAEQLEAVALPESRGAQLVFVNGRYSPALSNTDRLPQDIVVGSLATLAARADLLDRLRPRLAQMAGGHEVFTALNTAGLQDVAVVWLPRNQVVDVPVQVIFVSVAQAEAAITQPRCLVVAEAGSALTLVEDFWGAEAGSHFANAVSEIWVDDNAEVTHLRLQREGAGTFHIGKTAVTQGRDSRYRGTAIALGARLSRHTWEMYQAGEQTDTQMTGLSAISNSQVSDTHSLIALAHPHGTVNQLHKCIVDDRAHSVFSGMIAVPHGAQMTSASQLNRNLLLSNQGRVDTKPQLDIVADNVKCSHGATVSQLEADEIFYLQSRGIDADQAQRLLLYAFAMEVIDAIPIPSLKAVLTQQVTDRTA